MRLNPSATDSVRESIRKAEVGVLQSLKRQEKGLALKWFLPESPQEEWTPLGYSVAKAGEVNHGRKYAPDVLEELLLGVSRPELDRSGYKHAEEGTSLTPLGLSIVNDRAEAMVQLLRAGASPLKRFRWCQRDLDPLDFAKERVGRNHKQFGDCACCLCELQKRVSSHVPSPVARAKKGGSKETPKKGGSKETAAPPEKGKEQGKKRAREEEAAAPEEAKVRKEEVTEAPKAKAKACKHRCKTKATCGHACCKR
jgi:hypothetical protein